MTAFKVVRMGGKVVKGFGRGSKELGIPTANLPEEEVARLAGELETGVYFGWCRVMGNVYKMVMSMGWNPYYKNERKSAEVHVMNKFDHDFYGEELKVVVVGYIRPERNFTSLDALISAIQDDIRHASEQLSLPELAEYHDDPFLRE